MTCPSCRAPIVEGARFCASCGYAIQRRTDERRVVTVLFADLVGFTTLSEMLDPEQVKNVVDRCFELLVADITAFGGQVDKIVGDAILALFGAPTAHEDDAERAVRAGLQMQRTLDHWSSTAGANQLQMRVGINTGEVLVGAMRAGGDYTAMGDVVNTAQRLQTIAQPGQVVVGPSTQLATRQVVSYAALGLVTAKGREEPVEAYVAEQALLPPGARPGRGVTPLIGREHELDLLDRAIDASVRRRRAQLLLVVAEAGMGKTRLAEEAAARAESCHEASVFEGRCVPYGEANVWWPVAEALRSGIRLGPNASIEEARERTTERVTLALTGATPAEIERVVNGLLHLLAYDGPLQNIDPTRAREEARRSLLVYIEGFARQRPLIVVLSDLHWADDAVLELADMLLERIANLPVVLVATARDSLLERWQPRTGRHNLLLLNLDPLDHESAGELLDAMVDEQLPDDLRKLLLDRSGGNPFFLEELVSLLAEGGVVDGSDGSTTRSSSSELPHTLRGLVAARLDALSSDERCVLEDAAVLGRRGPVFALEIMCEKVEPPVDAAAGIAGLVNKDVFVVENGNWSFRSDLVREVAYGMLTKSERARRHFGVASWMEQHIPDTDNEVDRIAHHYATSAQLASEVGGVEHFHPDAVNVRERAVHWLGRALDHARRGELHPVAFRLCSQALELQPPLDGSARRRFLIGRARAATNLHDLEQAKADLDEAMGGAVECDDEQAVAEVLLERGELEQKRGDLGAAAETLKDAVHHFRAVGDRRGEAAALRSFGLTQLFADEAASAASSFTEALEIFRELGDRRGVAWALQNLAWVAYVRGDAESAEQWLDESIAVFSELGDSGGLGWATGLLAFVRYHQGRYDDAESLAERMLIEAAQRGDRWAEGMMRALLGLLSLWTGRSESAVEHAEKALAVFRSIHDWYGEMLATGALGRALLAAGRVDEGFTVMNDAVSSAALVPVGAATNMAYGTLMTAAAQAGLPERAPGAPSEREDQSRELGWLDLHVARNVLQMQSGSVDGVRASMESIVEAGGEDASCYARAALALARAVEHDAPGALAAFRDVAARDASTYSDRIMAMIGAGVAAEHEGDAPACDALLRTAQELIDSTEDRLLAAVVRLAQARVAEHRGDEGAAEALRRAHLSMSAMGVSQPGWDTLLRLALS